MKDGPVLDNNASDLSLGAGIGMINKNRRPLDSNGVAYGGGGDPLETERCKLHGG